MTPKERAARYRRLALAEPDKAKAAILNQIADEAERDRSEEHTSELQSP